MLSAARVYAVLCGCVCVYAVLCGRMSVLSSVGERLRRASKTNGSAHGSEGAWVYAVPFPARASMLCSLGARVHGVLCGGTCSSCAARARAS